FVAERTKPPGPRYGPKTRTARGRFFVGEPVAMHRPAKVPFDGMGLPLILADGLQAIFADIASSPLPERLASLMRSLRADSEERLGEEPDHGASAAETSSRVDRRRRCRTPQPDGGAVRGRASGNHRVRKRRSSAGNPADRRA